MTLKNLLFIAVGFSQRIKSSWTGALAKMAI
jgi:hypothetical protein